MEVVYLDRLAAVNFLIDYCVLLAAGRFCGVALRRGRYALAALVGAIYASLLVLPGWGWLAHPPAKLAAGCLLALIAFGGEAGLGRCTAAFFAVAALFGGGVYAASLLAGAEPLRGTAVPLSGRVFALSFAVCYTVIALVFRRRMKQANRVIRPVVIRLAGREARLIGLRDSGNRLSDPVTGKAAAVADRACLTRQLGLPPLPRDPAEALTRLNDRPEYRGRFRLLPYRTVGASGMLLAFRPDEAEVDGAAETMLIALAPEGLGEADCQILLPEE